MFISPVASDALIFRRIDSLADLGVKPVVLYFQRDYYKGRESTHETQKLGELAHSSVFGRITTYLRAWSAIRKHVQSSDIVYAFSSDLTLLALLARAFSGSRPKLVCEVQDIHSLLVGSGPLAWAFRQLDNFIVNQSDLLVVTSEEYISGYYAQHLDIGKLNHFVQENKVDGRLLDRTDVQSKAPNSPLVIGYFGLLRCKTSWSFLMRFIERSAGDVHLYVRGKVLGIDSFEQDVAASEWIEYGGEYVSPDDLPEMYAVIDLSWVAHAHGLANSQWARSNRFYEAMYFGVPMIAQEGTVDSRFVSEAMVGTVIDMHQYDVSENALKQISLKSCEAWRANIGQVANTVYELTDDHERLLAKIIS
ncbi:MAG: glycosyltransferase [Pseudomonadota bacterium]